MEATRFILLQTLEAVKTGSISAEEGVNEIITLIDNKKLITLLETAICPACDGSGAIQTRISEWEQCQWCYERNEILNKD